MTTSRIKSIKEWAEDVGLVLIDSYRKRTQVVAKVRAPNGVEQEFLFAFVPSGDVRAELNERARLKRFARANTPEEEMSTITLKPKTNGMTMFELVKLFEWVKTAAAEAANMEVLTHRACQHIGATITEDQVREAMQATNTAEPEHWTPLPEPQHVLARELARLMEQLGVEQSSQFKRTLEALS